MLTSCQTLDPNPVQTLVQACWAVGLQQRSIPIHVTIYVPTGAVLFACSTFTAVTLQSLLRSMTLGASALAAAAAGSTVPRECCFFGSIAADGKVSNHLM